MVSYLLERCGFQDFRKFHIVQNSHRGFTGMEEKKEISEHEKYYAVRANYTSIYQDAYRNKVYINEHLESPEYTGYFDEMNKRFDEIMASE